MKKICRAKLHEFEGKQCKQCLLLRKDLIIAKSKLWAANNRDKLRKNQKNWYLKNKKSKNLYEKNKRKKSISFRLKKNIRTRLYLGLKNKKKCGSFVKLIGCTGEQLKSYLESLFLEGMSWENYGNKEGNWSIDHIIPLSKVDLQDTEHFFKVNHYTNLQPMWHIDNIRKGNRI